MFMLIFGVIKNNNRRLHAPTSRRNGHAELIWVTRLLQRARCRATSLIATSASVNSRKSMRISQSGSAAHSPICARRWVRGTRVRSFNWTAFTALLSCTACHSATRRQLYWAFTRYDRRTDRSVRLVGPTIVSCKRFVRPVG